jgi:hypothetical protein
MMPLENTQDQIPFIERTRTTVHPPAPAPPATQTAAGALPPTRASIPHRALLHRVQVAPAALPPAGRIGARRDG